MHGERHGACRTPRQAGAYRFAVSARDAMRFAQERYRVGLNTFVDVAQARADRERAENDRIAAIYDYHRAYSALEAAVGGRIR